MKQLIMLFHSAQYDALGERVKAILDKDPHCGFAWQISGAALEKQGKDGLSALKKAAQLLPNDAGAHNNLGNALREHHQYTDAIASFRQALALKPDFAIAHSGLGLSLRDAGKIDDAMASFRLALVYKPDLTEAYNNWGNTLQTINCFDDAIVQYRRALLTKPDSVEVHNNLGSVLRDKGLLDEAIAIFTRAAQLSPQSAVVHRNLGNAFYESRMLTEAAASFRQVLKLDANSAEVHTNLGNALWDAGQYGEAMASFRRAVEIDAEFAIAHYNLGNSYQYLGQFDEAISCYRRVLQIKPDFDTAYSSLLFALGHSDGVDAQTLFAQHCGFGEHFEAPLRAAWPQHENSRDPERQLRIGFVSGDLRNHAVALFMEPIFAELTRSKLLSLHVYHNHASEDAVTTRLRALVPYWNNVTEVEDDALAEMVRADGIDILIDLSGHTALHRLLTFARKPAPLQASWIGYPGTTGLQAMDYYLADRFFLPVAQFAGQFTEKIAHLPVNAPFLPYANAPEINGLPLLDKGYMTFGSFNRISKISRPVVALWAQLLRALPDSRMLLGGTPGKDQCQALLNWFELEGIATERIAIYPRSDMEAYLTLHHDVDLCLDTFPYTGGSTTWQALWMGVPTLTLVGNTPCGRPGAAILARVGLETFSAQDAPEFVQKGTAWATQAETLAEIRMQLRERFAQSAVGQPSVVANGLEQTLRTMWRRWCSGLPAAHF